MWQDGRGTSGIRETDTAKLAVGVHHPNPKTQESITSLRAWSRLFRTANNANYLTYSSYISCRLHHFWCQWFEHHRNVKTQNC